MRRLYPFLFFTGLYASIGFLLYAAPHSAHAADNNNMELTSCGATDLKCVLDYTYQQSDSITEARWRDQVLRDIIMRYADAGHKNEALSLIPKVQDSDTRAMSIRAAGMGLAKHSTPSSTESDKAYFRSLKEQAETIEHDGARAIAYTYIAMSQALAGLDGDATITAKNMDNAALRNKAFAENAEIQAERRDKDAALESISHIDSAAFRDKAYTITADIFIKQEQYNEALDMASRIENAYKQSKVLLDLTAAQINKLPSEQVE